LRALPFLSRGFENWPADRNLHDDLTKFLRSCLTSGVASTCPTPDVKTAAYAAYAANAAADTAAFWEAVARDVRLVDDGIAEDMAALMRHPIWPQLPPSKLAEQNADFLAFLKAEPSLNFWGRWFEKAVIGAPMNWEMQEEIALINDEVWKAGAEAVAGEIAKIEAKYQKPSIPRDALRAQAIRLLDQAVATELTAEQLAYQIETALTEHARECGNELPEEFAILERMPRTLRTISAKVQASDRSTEKIAELEALVESHAAEIQVLAEKLAEAEAKCVTGQFKKSFYEQAGKSLGDWKLYGAVLTGGYAILGGEIFGMTVGNMSESVKELFKSGGGGTGEVPRKLPQIGVPPSR